MKLNLIHSTWKQCNKRRNGLTPTPVNFSQSEKSSVPRSGKGGKKIRYYWVGEGGGVSCLRANWLRYCFSNLLPSIMNGIDLIKKRNIILTERYIVSVFFILFLLLCSLPFWPVTDLSISKHRKHQTFANKNDVDKLSESCSLDGAHIIINFRHFQKVYKYQNVEKVTHF